MYNCCFFLKCIIAFNNTIVLCMLTIFMTSLRRFSRQRRDFANKRQRCVTGHHFPEGRRTFGRRICKSDTALWVRWFSLAPCSIVEARQGLVCRKSYIFCIFSYLKRLSRCKQCSHELPNSFFQILSLFSPLLRPTNLERFCDTNLPRPSVRSSLITCASDAFRFWQKLRASV